MDERYEKLVQRLAALEEQSRKDSEAVRALDGLVKRVLDRVITYEKEQTDVRSTMSGLRELSLEAKRVASTSVADFASMTSSIVAHLARTEKARETADAEQNLSIEAIRRALEQREAGAREASAAHAKRFQALGEAVNALAKHASGDRRIRVWSLIVIPALVVVLGQVVDLAKFFIAAQHDHPAAIESKPP